MNRFLRLIFAATAAALVLLALCACSLKNDDATVETETAPAETTAEQTTVAETTAEATLYNRKAMRTIDLDVDYFTINDGNLLLYRSIGDQTFTCFKTIKGVSRVIFKTTDNPDFVETKGAQLNGRTLELMIVVFKNGYKIDFDDDDFMRDNGINYMMEPSW